ncbi:MAG: hypothetical protein ACLRSY_10890, partial [Acutalibacter sp.]
AGGRAAQGPAGGHAVTAKQESGGGLDKGPPSKVKGRLAPRPANEKFFASFFQREEAALAFPISQKNADTKL